MGADLGASLIFLSDLYSVFINLQVECESRKRTTTPSQNVPKR